MSQCCLAWMMILIHHTDFYIYTKEKGDFMKRILAGLLAMLLILAEPCCMSAADALSANAAPILHRSISAEKEGSAG